MTVTTLSSAAKMRTIPVPSATVEHRALVPNLIPRAAVPAVDFTVASVVEAGLADFMAAPAAEPAAEVAVDLTAEVGAEIQDISL